MLSHRSPLAMDDNSISSFAPPAEPLAMRRVLDAKLLPDERDHALGLELPPTSTPPSKTCEGGGGQAGYRQALRRPAPKTTTSTSSSSTPSPDASTPSSSCSAETVTPASSTKQRTPTPLLDDLLPAKFALRIPPSSTPSFGRASPPLPASSSLPLTSKHGASPPLARRFSNNRRPSLEETDPSAARSYAQGLASHHKDGLINKARAGSVTRGDDGRTRRRVSPLALPARDDSRDFLPSSGSTSSVVSTSHSEALSTSSSVTSLSTAPSSAPAPASSLEPTSLNAVLYVKRKRDILPTLLFILYLRLQTIKSSLASLVSSDFLLDVIFPASHPSHAYGTNHSLSYNNGSVSRRRTSRRRQGDEHRSGTEIKAMLLATIMLSFRSVLARAVGLDLGEGAAPGGLLAGDLLFRLASSFLGVSELNIGG